MAGKTSKRAKGGLFLGNIGTERKHKLELVRYKYLKSGDPIRTQVEALNRVLDAGFKVELAEI